MYVCSGSRQQMNRPSAYMHYILHIDTSGLHCHILLSSDGQLCHAESSGEKDQRNHASLVNGMIQRVLQKSGVGLYQVQAICVMAGPGSYTGLRIGMATAKGISYITEAPLILTDRLRLAAFEAMDQHPGARYYGALIPARSGEYFIAVYASDGKEVLPPAHMEAERINQSLEKLQGAVWLCASLLPGDPVEAIPKSSEIHLEPYTDASPAFWCRYSYSAFLEKKFTDVKEATPFYLKNVYIHSSR